MVKERSHPSNGHLKGRSPKKKINALWIETLSQVWPASQRNCSVHENVDLSIIWTIYMHALKFLQVRKKVRKFLSERQIRLCRSTPTA